MANGRAFKGRAGAESLHEMHMHERSYGCFSSFVLGKSHVHAQQMWALSRETADPPGQLITGVPGRGDGPDGRGCIGECWGQAER